MGENVVISEKKKKAILEKLLVCKKGLQIIIIKLKKEPSVDMFEKILSHRYKIYNAMIK